MDGTLFAGLTEAEAAPYLTGMRAYRAGEMILRAGEAAPRLPSRDAPRGDRKAPDNSRGDGQTNGFDRGDRILASGARHLNGIRRGGGAEGDGELAAGTAGGCFGLVAEGSVLVYKEDWFGNRDILNLCLPGETFLEAVSLTRPEDSPVNVQAATDCTVLFLDYRTLLAPARDCRVHARLLENLLRVLARKTLSLNRRISVLSARTIRDKVLRYLKEASGGKRTFTSAFNRGDLADYLCVDRAALSRELSAMKRRGEIDFCGNRFTVKVEPR